MAKRHDILGVASADTVIGSGVRLKGNLASDGDIIIDGVLQGNVKAQGNVTIGVNAEITGDIGGQNVAVSGRLLGNIKASEQTSIAETGEVTGDITTTLLSVGVGAVFSGAIAMPKTKGPEPVSPTDTQSPPNRKV